MARHYPKQTFIECDLYHQRTGSKIMLHSANLLLHREPNTTGDTGKKSGPGQFETLRSVSGEKAPGIKRAAHSMIIQRGTKRPLGKRKKKITRDGKPTTSSLNRVIGTHQARWAVASTPGMSVKEPPRATRKKEASKAIQ